VSEALERLVARSEITDLLGRYCIAFDDQDWDTLATLWSDDAQFLVDGIGPVGHAAVIEFLSTCLPAGYRSKHMISPPVVDFAADLQSARVRTDVIWLTQEFKIQIVARYDDQVVKRDGRWLLQHRNERPVPFQPGPPPMSDQALGLSTPTMKAD
jgi:uncharacterized protein (TIGR02246 family)